MVSPFNRVSERPANLGPGSTLFARLARAVPRSRSFDFSPNHHLPVENAPSLSQLLGDLVEEHVVDSEEKETPIADSHVKNKKKSKYTISATRLEDEQDSNKLQHVKKKPKVVSTKKKHRFLVQLL